MQNVFVRPVRQNDAGEIVREGNPAFASAPNVIVRDPVSGVLLARDGENKPHNDFWTRRLRDHDVEECLSPAARAAIPKKPAIPPAAPPAITGK